MTNFRNWRRERSLKIARKTNFFNCCPIWKIPKIILVYVSSRFQICKKNQNSKFAHAQIAFEFSHVISMGAIHEVFSATRAAKYKRITASGCFSGKNEYVLGKFSKFELRACANRRSRIFPFLASRCYILIFFSPNVVYGILLGC